MAPPGGEQAQMPEMPKMPNMWPLLITMVIVMALYMIDQWKFPGAFIADGPGQDGNAHNLGYFVNYIFGFLGFDGKYPVLTLMIVGTVMVLLSSILRTALTDTLAQQKATAYNSAFQKELREARRTNNMYKVKKLTEMQPEVMAKSMESSGAMMKIMPYTMLIVVPMFLWVRYYVGVTCTGDNLIISVPWCSFLEGQNIGVSLRQSFVFPAWILVYSLVSIPIGQFVSRAVRFYQFKKKLAQIEAGPVSTHEAMVEATKVADAKAEETPVAEAHISDQHPIIEEAPPETDNKQEPPKEGL